MKLDVIINVLTGNESLELLIVWELDFGMRITNNDTMTLITKLNILKLLEINDALSVFEDSFKLFENASELSVIDKFRNPGTKLNIEKLFSGDKKKID